MFDSWYETCLIQNNIVKDTYVKWVRSCHTKVQKKNKIHVPLTVIHGNTGQINLKYWYLLGEMLWYVWHWISPLLQTCHLLKSNTTGGTSGMRTANLSWFVVEIAVLGLFIFCIGLINHCLPFCPFASC